MPRRSCARYRGRCCCFLLDVPHPDPPPLPRPAADQPTAIPYFTVFKKKHYFTSFLSHTWRMWENSRPHSQWSSLENRGGLSASSHPGVSVGSPPKLVTQSIPPWSESLAVATHNPYSKGQLDWDHGAKGEQRELPPPPTSVTEYPLELWRVKIENGLNSRYLATAL